MNAEQFDNLSLPKINPNDELETLSRNKLNALFQGELFEARDENQHDKGVDLTVELKRNGQYTNFRFAIQLKATQSITPNRDGSISFAVDVTNINYLLNYGMPAYYVLFDKQQDRFYVESVYKVYEDISAKYTDGAFPEQFTVRFQQQFSVDLINKLYQQNLDTGRVLRNLGPVLQLNLQHSTLASRIVIDENQEVFTSADKMRFIETNGYYLLNRAEFKRIIEIEQECYPLVNASTGFHLICGMAYYHRADMFKAVDHFKLAKKGAASLHTELQGMLSYYNEMARYALGISSVEKIQSVIRSLKESEYLGLFLRIEQAYNDFILSEKSDEEKMKFFYDTLFEIKNNPRCDESMTMIADSHILSAEGSLTNELLAKSLMKQKDSPVPPDMTEDLKIQQEMTAHYTGRMNTLREQALASGNQLAYNTVCISGVKTKYERLVFTHYILFYDEATGDLKQDVGDEERTIINAQCDFLRQIEKNYQQHSSLENQVYTLSIIYELWHFLGEIDKAKEAAVEMYSIIETNDLNNLMSKYLKVTKGGTTHEIFLAFLRERLKGVKEARAELDSLNAKLQEIDKKEGGLKIVYPKDAYQITIFPLGTYSFPKTELEMVVQLISAGDSGIFFKEMLNLGIVPVANILNNPVLNEGYGNGIADHKGLESVRNLYRVSHELFERNIYRIKMR